MTQKGPVLGIECSGETAGVALVWSGGLAERSIRAPGKQLTLLFPLMLELLADCSLEPGQLWRVAVSSGPGSFTSLRLALITARTAAQVLGIGVIGLSTLQVVAWGLAEWYREQHGDARQGVRVLVLTDARKGQVFAAAFDVDVGGASICVEPSRAMAPPEAGAWLDVLLPTARAGRPVLIGGSGLVAYPDLLGSTGAVPDETYLCPAHVGVPRARHVALAGAGRYGHLDEVPYTLVEPTYLRAPDVQPPRGSRM